MAIINSMQGFLGSMKQRCGYFAIAAFLMEVSALSWLIQRSRSIQQNENRDRVSLALTNYRLL